MVYCYPIATYCGSTIIRYTMVMQYYHFKAWLYYDLPWYQTVYCGSIVTYSGRLYHGIPWKDKRRRPS
jgi:hypothetical protein